MARTVGPAFDYRLRWTWVLGAAAFVATAWASWRAAARRLSGTAQRGLVGLSLAVLAILCVVNTVDAWGLEAVGSASERRRSAVLGEVVEDVLNALPQSDGPVLLRSGPALDEQFLFIGLLLQLERAGVQVGVTSDPFRRFGRHRVYRTGPTRMSLVILGNARFDAALGDPDLRLVAASTEGLRSDRKRLVAAQRRVQRRYEAGELSQADYLRRLAPLELGLTVGIFEETAQG